VEPIEIMEKLRAMYKREERAAVNAEALLAPLPDDAWAGPKLDARGEPLHTWDAELTGYLPARVMEALHRRLGPGAWVDYPVILDEGQAQRGQRATYTATVALVCYCPPLDTGRVEYGTGEGYTRADALKSACTAARKRAIYLATGIGWQGYTDREDTDKTQQKQQVAKNEAPAARQQTQKQPELVMPTVEECRALLRQHSIDADQWRAVYGQRRITDLTDAERVSMATGLLEGSSPLLQGAQR